MASSCSVVRLSAYASSLVLEIIAHGTYSELMFASAVELAPNAGGCLGDLVLVFLCWLKQGTWAGAGDGRRGTGLGVPSLDRLA